MKGAYWVIKPEYMKEAAEAVVKHKEKSWEA